MTAPVPANGDEFASMYEWAEKQNKLRSDVILVINAGFRLVPS